LRGYELCLIFQHETNEDSIDQKVEALRGKAEAIGGKVMKVEKWGKRSLKFAIKKQQKGYYCFVSLTGNNKTLHEIERIFKYDESVLRYSYIRLEEAQVEAINKTLEPSASTDATTEAPKATPEDTAQETKDEPAATAETGDPAETAAAENPEASDIEI